MSGKRGGGARFKEEGKREEGVMVLKVVGAGSLEGVIGKAI